MTYCFKMASYLKIYLKLVLSCRTAGRRIKNSWLKLSELRYHLWEIDESAKLATCVLLKLWVVGCCCRLKMSRSLMNAVGAPQLSSTYTGCPVARRVPMLLFSAFYERSLSVARNQCTIYTSYTVYLWRN